MAPINLKSLSVPQLLALQEDIDRHLQLRRAELQAQLAQIGMGDRGAGRAGSGMKVAPKYRHPETGETWTGRGGVAGWLAKELKAGKKREDFLIVRGKEERAAAKPAQKAGKGAGAKRR